jgi:HK97 family phage major capsid protein
MSVDTQLKELHTDIKGFVERTQANYSNVQKQIDAIDLKLAGRIVADDGEYGSIGASLKENDSVRRLMQDKRGHAVIELNGKQVRQIFEQKTVTTAGNASLSSTGVLRIDRMLGITTEARETLTIRDVLDAKPTAMQIVDFVKVNSPLVAASPQVEASSKYANNVTFTSLSERVKTIATYIRASRQILDDMDELENFLMSSLPYEVNLAEELELLSGSNSGEHLNGLITQATPFNTSLLSAPKGWNTMDIVGLAVQQIRSAKEVPPTFIVLNPTDWWGMRLTKDQFGRYILGDPQTEVMPSLFGKKVVETTNIAAGTFLLGSGDPVAAQIRDRMGMTVDISFEDADNFTTNLVTIRAEKRLALVVRRPGSFITGSFTSSPA